MDKIDFVNATQPALNDTNLNLMQDNIERAINAQVSGDTLPIGTLLPFTSTTTPANWLLCDGRAVSRTTYSQLYNVIGTRYGTGDGSTTFNLPDLRGRVPVGYDSSQTEFNSTGKTGGAKTVTLTVEQIPSHNHTLTGRKSGSIGDVGYPLFSNTGTLATTDQISNTGGGQPHNNLQPYIVTRYIIKAFQTAGTIASVINVHSTSTTNIYSAGYINNGVTGAQVYAPVTPSKDDTILLSSSFASGNYIEIIYGRFRVVSSDIAWQSTGKLPYTDGMTINLQCIYAAGGAEPTAESNSKLVIISGNSLTTSTKLNDNIAIAKIIKYNAI